MLNCKHIGQLFFTFSQRGSERQHRQLFGPETIRYAIEDMTELRLMVIRTTAKDA